MHAANSYHLLSCRWALLPLRTRLRLQFKGSREEKPCANGLFAAMRDDQCDAKGQKTGMSGRLI